MNSYTRNGKHCFLGETRSFSRFRPVSRRPELQKQVERDARLGHGAGRGKFGPRANFDALPSAQTLRGFINPRRIRVGQYRVVYEVYVDRVIVYIISVGHRREIYEIVDRRMK